MFADEVKKLQAAGFSDIEVNDYAMQQRQTLVDGGFSQSEIDTHFGYPPFDPKPIHGLIKQNHAAVQPASKDSPAKPVTSFEQAIEAGFQMSVTGLLARGKTPSLAVNEDTPRMMRVASQITSLAGDVPAMLAGGFLGGPGGPVGATAGAFALPAGLRQVLMDKYANGEVKDFATFWDRLSSASIETLKGLIVGGATGAAGKAVGMAKIVSPTAKAAATVASEVTTMVGIGNALEGTVPKYDDFLDAVLAIGFIKGTTKAAGKLRNIYAKTGVTPEQFAQDAMKDPTIVQDFASHDMDIPRAYGGEQESSTIPEAKKAQGQPPVPPVAAAATTPPAPKSAKQVVLDHIVQDEPIRNNWSWSDLYTDNVDSLNPIKQALEEGGQADLPTSKNPLSLERLARGTMGKATEFLKSGAFEFDTYKTVTKGLEQILEPVKKDLDGFRAYMVAKRAIEKAGQGIETGIPLAEAKQVVKDGTAKYEQVFRERVGYRNALLDYLQKSGILSEEAVAAMRLANKDYVPFYRFFEEQQGGPSSSSKGVRNPIKKMTGSERLILDPIVSDIKDTYLFVGLAERNAARQAFIELGSDFAVKQKPPILAVHITEHEIRAMIDEFLSFKTEKTKSSKRTSTTTTTGEDGKTTDPLSRGAKLLEAQLTEALTSRGRSKGEAEQIIRRVVEAKSGQAAGSTTTTTETIIKELNSTTYVPEIDVRLPNEVATVFRAMQAPLGKDEIAVFTDGKRGVYKVDPKVAEAFQDIDKVSSHQLVAMLLHTPASLLRAGVTITPDFIARNVLRDAISAFIYSGSNPIKTALGMKSLLTKDTAFHNWMKGGGANATMVAIDRDYIHKNLVDLDLETGLMTRAWNVVKTPLDLLRATSELVENSTRLGAVRSELLKSQDKARIQALSLIAREATVDFARHGRTTQGFAKATAFFNPAIQGLDRFAREIKNNPTAALSKAFVAVTLPSLALWYANRGDKDIENLPRWQKDLFWITRVPLPGGGSFLLRIPKPMEFGVLFGSLPERLLDAFVAENPGAMKGIGETLSQAFLPNLIPTAVVPVVSQYANRNYFTGGALVPQHLEGLMPEYQYTEYTTEAAKAISSLIGAFPGMERTAMRDDVPLIGGVARALTTPALVETYVRDWTGGMGMYLLQLADKGLREANVLPNPAKPASTLADIPFVKAFVVRYPSAQAQSIQDFYDEYAGKKKVYDTFVVKMKEGDLEASKKVQAFDPSAMVQLDDVRTTLAEHSTIIREIYKNPSMKAEEKRQLIDTLYYRMIELSQFGNVALRDIEQAVKGGKQ